MITNGETAYNGYCASSGGKSLISGAALPAFDKLPRNIQIAWEEAAHAVYRRVIEKLSQGAL